MHYSILPLPRNYTIVVLFNSNFSLILIIDINITVLKKQFSIVFFFLSIKIYQSNLLEVINYSLTLFMYFARHIKFEFLLLKTITFKKF